MKINFSEQRELADFIALRIGHQELADDIWFAVEDFTGSDPDGPDALQLAKERIENEDLPREAYDPHDAEEILRYE